AAGVETQVRPIAVLRRALLSPRKAGGLAVRTGLDALGLGRLIRARGISLVHSNTSVILSGAAAARRSGVPHVFSVREIYTDFARLWPYYRRFLLTAGALCCVSEATRAQFDGHPRAHLLHDGVGPVARAQRSLARQALGLSEGTFVCATLGRISSWKGQDVLARALAQPALARAGAVGLVAGDAWPGQEHRQEELTALAGRLGLGQRLRLLGFRGDTSTIYGAADVVVVPSTNPDPLPNVALEAAACGCCVVAADHGGLPEIIRDGDTGRLFAPGQPEALAAVLDELRQDRAQRIRLGAAASADVTERFSPARLLQGLQALYDQVRAVPA
ncbi:MAG TPA: glycosyltransferase family 4 protein, partial [Solirubrobacteraceae bacterium]|nr:glycosyltransferase family 4 protein [Solirubrobacteraceae bacterium]